MNAALLLLLLSWGPDTKDELSRCIERKDQKCVSVLLANRPESASPEYLAVAARGYMLLGKRQDAIDAISRAAEMRPGDYGYLMEQGWIYQRSGDQPSAIHAFLLAAKTKLDSPDVFYELGMSFFFAQEYQRAARHFQRTLQLDPKHDRAEFMLGLIAIWSDQFAQAELQFKKALELRPASSDYLLHYGVLLAKMDQDEKAMTEMLRAEQIDPANPLTHFNLGKLYRKQGKLAEAQRELEAAVKLRPGFSSALYQLASIYRQAGDQTKAQQVLQQFQKFSAQEKEQEEDPIDASVSH